MRDLDESFDIVISILMMVMMLGVYMWSADSMSNSPATKVIERTAVHNTYGMEAKEPKQTSEDALLSLVVSDPYTTAPNKVTFKSGAASYTTTLDNAFFKDQQASIETSWGAFFKNHMGLDVTSVNLDTANNCWVVVLAS